MILNDLETSGTFLNILKVFETFYKYSENIREYFKTTRKKFVTPRGFGLNATLSCFSYLPNCS